MKRKAAGLVLDFDLYPRTSTDSANVTRLREAIRAGVDLPPVVVDKKSSRVVDGFHRVRAVLAENGPDAEIEVVEKSYKTEGDLFLDAVRHNASHGAKLDSNDAVHCAIACERLKIDTEALAGALSMTVDKLAKMTVDRTATAGGLRVPIKNTVRHMAGRRLRKNQADAMSRIGGMNQMFYVNQIITLIETDMLDKENEPLMERLDVLHGLLGSMMASK